MEISKGTVIRTVVLAVALLNQVLAVFGKSPLPIEEAQLEIIVSTGFTVVTAILAWWKNNSFTRRAVMADRYLDKIRGGDFVNRYFG